MGRKQGRAKVRKGQRELFLLLISQTFVKYLLDRALRWVFTLLLPGGKSHR
jgi:hypothetical protein